MTNLTSTQTVQEEQYNFPYHYADFISDRHKYFKLIEPMDLMRLVKNKVLELNRKSVLDAGCGDGRLCYELKGNSFEVTGIDYSARAIAFARAFNPELVFYKQDLKHINLPEKFDVIILMEVIEHFIPDEIPAILSGLSGILNDNGVLLITTPTDNLKIPDKHYLHFNRQILGKTIHPYFSVTEITGYSCMGFSRWLFRFLRSLGNLLYPFRKETSLAQWYFAFYRKFYEHYVSTGTPGECYGIMAVCHKIDNTVVEKPDEP